MKWRTLKPILNFGIGNTLIETLFMGMKWMREKWSCGWGDERKKANHFAEQGKHRYIGYNDKAWLL